jgi:hypothetical protein
MRVCYRARPAKRPGLVYELDDGVRCCCEGMRRHWNRLIGFGAPGCRASTSREVNLASARPQANGRFVWELFPISFCPWCGEAVEVCRVK